MRPVAISVLVGSLVVGGASVSVPAAAEVSVGGALQAQELDDQAQSKYLSEVLVLHATNSKKGIDKRIGEMPELKKPPFSAYDSYELLTKKRLPLIKGDPKEMELPNGRVLRTELLEELPKDTVKLSASISRPKGKAFLPLLEVKAKAGRAFIVAGPKHKGGILVLVIRVLTREAVEEE